MVHRLSQLLEMAWMNCGLNQSEETDEEDEEIGETGDLGECGYRNHHRNHLLALIYCCHVYAATFPNLWSCLTCENFYPLFYYLLFLF